MEDAGERLGSKTEIEEVVREENMKREARERW